MTSPQAINPLSRRPKQKRLVIAVRGAAGSGKSWFASSLADAGLGRLLFLDSERKSRLLDGTSGSNPKFDAVEVYHPDELPQFIDWALDGEGREQNYGCYALDSWTMYFGRKHRQSVEAMRQKTGDPTAQPTADQLQADQMVYQEVLRRLCIDSGACVVITDQVAAKGKEDAEENEMGRVLPMTIGGLEYFADIVINLELRVDGFETARVARVIKSNSPHFPIGLEIKNPVFKDFLDRMDDLPQADEDDIPAFLKPQAEVLQDDGLGLEQLIEQAQGFGISKEQLLVAASHYHGVSSLETLNREQITDLTQRLNEKYKTTPSQEVSEPPTKRKKNSTKAVKAA